MGKVYVLAKADGGIQPTLGSQGNLGLMINPSPENIDYSKYGPSNSNQNKLARRFGNIGSKARYGLGALGALNSFYNTTSSGQPGALTSMGSGAMSGYYGSQGLERQAARHGAKVGVKRDNRERDAVWDEAQDENQMYDAYDEAQADNQQYNASPHPSVARRTEYMANTPEAVAERESRANQSNTGQVGVLGNAGGRGSPNIFSDNYANTQRYQQMMNKIPAPPTPPLRQPTGAAPPGPETNNSITSNLQLPQPVGVTSANTENARLENYGKPPVAVIDPAKLKEIQNESPDGVSSTVAGA